MSPVTQKLLNAVVGLLLQTVRVVVQTLTMFGSRLQLWRHRVTYQGRPDDLFIVTYPKSGTTLMQMIIHQLTTDGTVNFVHIDDVTLHLEAHVIGGKGLRDTSSPRTFKSHLPYSAMPKGPGRYIYVIRDGRDVAVSYYYHYRRLQRYTQPFETFFRSFLDGRVIYGSWFEHVAKWTANADGLNVLFVYYEDLVSDLEGQIRRVAQFCKVDIPTGQMPRMLQNCSFSFMKEHEEKFSPEFRRVNREFGFIRNGVVGEGKSVIDSAASAAFTAKFTRYLESDLVRRYRDAQS